MNKPYSVYRYQQNAFPALIGLSSGSILAGLLWLINPSAWLKGFGSQFLGWGAIDLFIALFGLKSAHRNEGKLLSGEISREEHHRQAINFERFVWVNVLLDFGYCLGGWKLVQKSQQSRLRQGMGWGIIFQGGILLFWDVFLALFAMRERHGQRDI